MSLVPELRILSGVRVSLLMDRQTSTQMVTLRLHMGHILLPHGMSIRGNAGVSGL